MDHRGPEGVRGKKRMRNELLAIQKTKHRAVLVNF